MLNLFPASVRPGGVPESVRPDDAPGMENNIVADYSPGVNHHSRINEAVFADGHILAYVYVRMDVRAVTHFGAGAHV